ncbi:MAG: four helix bundle protein [Gemmatimonadaceae bacterium]
MQDFKKLRVWHAARELSLGVIDALPDRVGRKVPKLRNQAIRAAMSVESNLAEGCGRSSRIEFLQFVEIALASLNELEAQLSLARDTRIFDTKTHSELYDGVDVVRRMLISLMRTLQKRIAEDEQERKKKREDGTVQPNAVDDFTITR